MRFKAFQPKLETATPCISYKYKPYLNEVFNRTGITNKPYQAWPLIKDGTTQIIKTPLTVETNQITSVYKLTLAGAGVSVLPTFLCQEAIDKGDLESVLTDWHYQDVPVHLVSPFSTSLSMRLKVVSDEIMSALRQVLV